jgi:hypothetical protein
MSNDANTEMMERLYDLFLQEGHGRDEAAELARKAFEEMA